MKKFILAVSFVLLTACSAFCSGFEQVAFKQPTWGLSGFYGSDMQRERGFGFLPTGLTFYNYFSNAVSGDKITLNADYSIGSPVATFTSTSGSFTITSSGYQATTANDEVLKYLTSLNCTAAVEMIIIRFTVLSSNFANDGVLRILHDTDTKQRWILKFTTSAGINIYPNYTDSNSSTVVTTTSLVNGSTYTFVGIMYGETAGTNVGSYIDAVLQNTSTNNYTAPTWGDYFYLGSRNTGASQANISIKSFARFSRALSASEFAVASSQME
jgi:hypothetical protein